MLNYKLSLFVCFLIYNILDINLFFKKSINYFYVPVKIMIIINPMLNNYRMSGCIFVNMIPMFIKYRTWKKNDYFSFDLMQETLNES